MRDRLKEKHARTYEIHRSSFNAWMLSRLELDNPGGVPPLVNVEVTEGKPLRPHRIEEDS